MQMPPKKHGAIPIIMHILFLDMVISILVSFNASRCQVKTLTLVVKNAKAASYITLTNTETHS